MNPTWSSRALRWAQTTLIGSLLVLLAACATGRREVWQKFAFDGDYDKWGQTVDLLDYAYGSEYNMVRNSVSNPRSSAYVGLEKLPLATNINGPMPAGEFLFVRWRVKATGQVYEERVDLRQRLPADMKDHGLTFVIDGPQLYVYVITPRPKPYYGAPPITRTWHSATRYTTEIFPQLTRP